MVVVFADIVNEPRGKRAKPGLAKPGVVRLQYNRRSPDLPYLVVSLTHRYPLMKIKAEARKVAERLDKYKIKGVYKEDPPSDKWRSFIVADARLIEAYEHDTKEEAARAHDRLLAKVKGPSAWNQQNYPVDRAKTDVSMQNLLSSLHGKLEMLHEGNWIQRKRKHGEYNVIQLQKRARPMADCNYAKMSQQEHHIVVLRKLIAASTIQESWEKAGAALLAVWKILVAREEGIQYRINRIRVGDWQMLVEIGTLALWKVRGRAYVLRFLRSCLAFVEYYRQHYDSKPDGTNETYYLEKVARVEHPALQNLREQIIISIAVIQRSGKGKRKSDLVTTQLEKHLRQDRYKRSSKLFCLTAHYMCSQALVDKKMTPKEKMDCYLKAMGMLKKALQCDPGVEAGVCLMELVYTLKTLKSKAIFRSLTQRSSQQTSEYTAANESEDEEDVEKPVTKPGVDMSEEVEEIVDKYCQDYIRDPHGWQAKVTLVESLPGRDLSLAYDLREWQRSDPLNKKPIKMLVKLCLKSFTSPVKDACEGESDASSFTGVQLLKLAYEALVDSIEHLSFEQWPSWSAMLNPSYNPAKPESLVVYLWETLVNVMHKTKPEATKEIFGQQWRKDLWRGRFFDSAENGSVEALSIRQQKLLHSQYEAAYRILGSGDAVVIQLWKLIS